MRYRTAWPRLRDTLAATKAWQDFAAQATGQQATPQLTPAPKTRAKRVSTGRTEPRERVNLADIIQLLRTHPKVAFAWRMQSGLFREGERYIKVGVTGIPDVIFMLVNGRFCGCEVKRKGGTVTLIQQKRIDQINSGGGLAFVAYGVDDVLDQLATVDISQWSIQR